MVPDHFASETFASRFQDVEAAQLIITIPSQSRENQITRFAEEKEAVLVVSPILRPWLAKLLRRASQEVRVLSYREVPDDQSIKIIQTIELEEKSENGVEE